MAKVVQNFLEGFKRVRRLSGYSLYLVESGVRVPKKAGACHVLNIPDMSPQNIKGKEGAGFLISLFRFGRRGEEGVLKLSIGVLKGINNQT